jgi:hypothetical protein
MPGKSCLPSLPSLKGDFFHPPREPIPIEFEVPSDSDYTWSGVNTEEALSIVVSSRSVQEATGLDRSSLLRRFSGQWTPESALNECESSLRLVRSPVPDRTHNQRLRNPLTMIYFEEKAYLPC